MKRLYTILLVIAGAALFASQAIAQTSGRAYAGYVQYNDQIYVSDGWSIDQNAKVACAIRLTAAQVAPYKGCSIVAMRVGWDLQSRNAACEGFVRNSLNGEDLTTGKVTAKFGWNNLTLTEYVIPEDAGELVVGYSTTVKKGEIAIPKLYPQGVPNSCFLWQEGDCDANGKPIWADMSADGALAILLTIKDPDGRLSGVPVITSLLDDGVVNSESPSTALMRVRNSGSQTIKSLEITSQQGSEVYSQTINLSKNIPQSTTSSAFMVPLQCFHSGDVQLSITKVNGKELAEPVSRTVNMIAVPTSVSKKYTRRPLLEYYESENSYMSARYFDEIVEPSLEGKLGKFTFICQHLDDQFMTGDDDATVQSLRLCDNDSALVSIPAMTIDRAISTDNILFQQSTYSTPMFSVLYEPYASQTFNAALKHPTFVSVSTAGNLGEDQETLSVEVTGEVANGIMSEGEKTNLTVYIMERFVHSDSQLFWTDKEKESYMGEYVHFNVIREVLTAPEGDPLTEGGTFQTTYTTQLDPSWNAENLYLVAFVHRNGAQGGKRMHVFNSAQGEIDLTNGICEMEDGRWEMEDGAVYDLSGRRVAKRSGAPRKGIYIVNSKKVVR